VSGVPQRPQKLRTTGGEERKRTGSPRVTAKASCGKVTHATAGAAEARRQLAQWQSVAELAAPVAR
jgi:hypothetical protein